MGRRPTTVEDAFHVSRRRFVPRVLMLFLLYVAAVLAPDLSRLIPDFADEEPAGAGITVPPMTISPPPVPTATPSDLEVAPVRTDDGWALDQPEFDTHVMLSANPEFGEARRVVQTFRSPGRGAAVTSVGVHIRVANGSLSVAVVELLGDSPARVRPLREVIVPATRLPAEAFVSVTIPPVSLRTDRTYGLVLGVGNPEAVVWIGHLSADVYRTGWVWLDGQEGWHPAGGDLAFRIRFGG